MRNRSLIAIVLVGLLTGVARADEPEDGKSEIVAGSVLLAVSVPTFAGAGVVWGIGAAKDPIGVTIGSSVTALGIGAFVSAAVLLPLGLVRRSRYKRAHHVELAPEPSGLALALRW